MRASQQELMEFASPDWFAFLRRLLVAVPVGLGKASPGVICEVFTNVPPHLCADASRRLAWTRRIDEDGSVTVALDECADDEADLKLIADYDALLPFARLLVTPETKAATDELMREAAAGGRLRVVRRTPETKGPDDPTIHNLLAALTR